MIVPDREEVRAMLQQALAEAHAQGTDRIARLHLELFDPNPQIKAALDDLVADLSRDTPADGARRVAESLRQAFSEMTVRFLAVSTKIGNAQRHLPV